MFYSVHMSSLSVSTISIGLVAFCAAGEIYVSSRTCCFCARSCWFCAEWDICKPSVIYMSIN